VEIGADVIALSELQTLRQLVSQPGLLFRVEHHVCEEAGRSDGSEEDILNAKFAGMLDHAAHVAVVLLVDDMHGRDVWGACCDKCPDGSAQLLKLSFRPYGMDPKPGFDVAGVHAEAEMRALCRPDAKARLIDPDAVREDVGDYLQAVHQFQHSIELRMHSGVSVPAEDDPVRAHLARFPQDGLEERRVHVGRAAGSAPCFPSGCVQGRVAPAHNALRVADVRDGKRHGSWPGEHEPRRDDPEH
jgi:hypothetical protein